MENKYITKIRALMEKTIENGCTPEEAEAASAKVSELMEQYHIADSDVMGSHDKNKRGEVMFKYGHSEPWTQSLASTVGRMTGCFILYGYRYAAFYGTEVAVDAAVYTMNNLQEQAAKMAFAYWTKVKDAHSPHDRGWVIRDYRLGIVHGIRNRVFEQQSQNTDGAGSKTGLVVINDALEKAKEYAATLTKWTSTSRSRGTTVRDGTAYYQGQDDSAGVTTQARLK
jgi:Protein of unknown function (DUF2786)